jgi:hypothetical protein
LCSCVTLTWPFAVTTAVHPLTIKSDKMKTHDLISLTMRTASAKALRLRWIGFNEAELLEKRFGSQANYLGLFLGAT